MDPLAALILQAEWGADEALEQTPRHCLDAAPTPMPVQTPAAAKVPPARRASPPARPEASTLGEFLALLAAFDGAGLAATATNLVPPIGPSFGLMVVGEAPGAAEDRTGDAFVGPEGQLLRRMLTSIRVDPAECMLAYLAPWRPPGGRAPNDSEVAACLPYLLRLIAIAQPRMLLALGSIPAKSLLGPGMRRGHWSELRISGLETSIAALPISNPAVLLRQPQQKPAAWANLRMLRRKIDEITIS